MSGMGLLDKIDFKKVDPDGMIKHIENFPQMCRYAFELSKTYSLPSYYIKARKVVLCGMGGSGQANDILRSFLSESNLIVASVHEYSLPIWADAETLVVAISYSGETEETIASFIEAHEKGAKLVAITTGGKLKALAEKYKVPCFAFDYQCRPRASFPYNFTLLLSVFIKLGILDISDAQFEQAVSLLQESLGKYGSAVSLFSNPAKILAEKIHGHVAVVYSTERLSGAANRLKAQFNENSKNFAFVEEIPELNHKSLIGYVNPKNSCFIVQMESNFDSERNILRENLTAEVAKKLDVGLERIKFVQATNLLSETMLMVMFGDFVSYYLAILNRANPWSQDAVDNFKTRLS